MTGLNTAYFLKKNYFLAEKLDRVGGLVGSIEKYGYIFDFAEHFLRIPGDPSKNLLKKLMGENLFSQELKSAIYFKKKYISYPFQNNIRELPIEELKKCALSLIQNHFKRASNKKDFQNFEEYIYYQYGDYIANEFMIPYNEKFWCIEPYKMNTSWFLSSDFMPRYSLEEIIENILPVSENTKLKKNLRWYPIKGGAQEFANVYLPFLSHLALNHEAIQIDINEKRAFFKNDDSVSYEYLISTIPLVELLSIINPISSEVKNLIPLLKYSTVCCLNLCLNRENTHNYHWLYFPQKEIPFSRLFFSSNFSKNNAPKEKGSCSALTTFLPESKFDLNQFEKETIDYLIKLGFLKNESEIVNKMSIKIQYGFTLPTIELNEHLRTITQFLNSFQIYSIGRYGEWKYSGIEHAIQDGKKIAEKLL